MRSILNYVINVSKLKVKTLKTVQQSEDLSTKKKTKTKIKIDSNNFIRLKTFSQEVFYKDLLETNHMQLIDSDIILQHGLNFVAIIGKYLQNPAKILAEYFAAFDSAIIKKTLNTPLRI